MAPSNLKYSESHEWCRLEGDTVVIGITAFAVEHLSDLTFVSLPEVGSTMQKGERFGEIESVKAVSELFSPISGKIVAVNESLSDDIEKIAKDPYGQGWMIKVQLTNRDELQALMSAEAYEKHIASEAA